MRKYSLLAVLLMAAVLIGCSGQPDASVSPTATAAVARETEVPSPVSEPSSEPSPTPVADSNSGELPAAPSPSALASCVAANPGFPVAAGLSPVTAEDHTRGSDDATITLIVYSDFQ
jgi:hypothetical protein